MFTFCCVITVASLIIILFNSLLVEGSSLKEQIEKVASLPNRSQKKTELKTVKVEVNRYSQDVKLWGNKVVVCFRSLYCRFIY